MAETSPTAVAVEPVLLDSRVREVRVFRSGAVVTRVADLRPAAAWPDEVSLVGLPLAIDDGSVRVSLVGPAGATLPRPADVRVDLVVPPIGESLQPPDEKELRAASDEVERLRALLARIDRETGRLDALGLALAEPFENRPPRPAPAVAWRGVLDWRFRWKRERAAERRKTEDELLRAQEHVARLARRLQQVRASQDARDAAVSKRVRLRLREGGAPVAATLALEYRVPGARWVPSYVFRMGRDGKSAQLAVKALVVQASGEPWERVKLSVSTADLLRDNELPELKSLRIGRQQPEPPAKAWREPPSGLEALFEGLDRNLEDSAPPPPADAPAAPPADESAFEEAAGELDGILSDARADEDASSVGLSRDRERSRRDVARAETAKKLAKPAPMTKAGRASGAPMPPPPPAPPPGRPTASMSMPAPAPMEMAPASAPVMSRSPVAYRAAGGGEMLEEESSGGFGGGAGDPRHPAFVEHSPDPDPRMLAFPDLVMSGWNDGGSRGRLRGMTIADRLFGLEPSHAPAVARRLEAASARAMDAAYVSFPDGTEDVGESTGSYDHRYDAEGLVDVPGDGRIHVVPLLARSAPVATTLVVVPRESTQAVRVAEMRNPLDAPLLAGPAEIYLDDEFLVTSPIRTVPAGADLRVGLGVEEALKVARNTHFDEEATGLLGGRAALGHKIEIELANRLGAPVKVEVRERVPVKDEEDKDIDIVVGEPAPPWEEWDQADTQRIRGGRRWKVTLSAGESKKLYWSYTIKIDSKNELAGGNRRE